MDMDRNDIYDLIYASLSGIATEEQERQLFQTLEADASARKSYADYMMTFTLFHRRSAASILAEEDYSDFDSIEATVSGSKVGTDSNVSLRGVNLEEFMSDVNQVDAEDSEITCAMLELLEMERTAPAFVIPKVEPPCELIQKVVHPPREKPKLTKFQKFFFAATAAAVIFFVLFVKFGPVSVPSVDVATVADQMNVKWADSSYSPKSGERLWTKDFPMDLKKGIISIEFDEGVEVTIEGPALFEVERSGIYLKYGRLYGMVSEMGLGFTVRTPTSQFVDQGTEFGVLADINGSSELHVTKGKVQLIAGLKGKPRVNQMITENKAARFDASNGSVKSIEVQNEAFVRDIDSDTGFIWKGQTTIDLADIFGGGNGFGSGKIGVCLGVRDGKFTTFRGYEDEFVGLRKPAKTFFQVAQSPYIDSVFMPDGGDGSVQVSSTGHVFDDCPDTSGWVSNYSIFSGDTLKLYRYSWPVQLDNKRYGTKKNPAITFAPNRGITFDLRAIRRYIGVVGIERFTAKCGIIYRNNWTAEGDADIHVLVDGQVRFKATGKTKSSEPSIIDVPLSRNDQFLTLVVTERNASEKGNWMVFAEPVLKLSDK